MSAAPLCLSSSSPAVTMPWESRAKALLHQPNLTRLGAGEGLTMMFPAFNDAHTIGTLIDYAAALLPRIADDYQIVVVNDGSDDETAVVLADRAARFPFLRVITHKRNQGYGAALRSGFAAATKDWVFYTDGDGQYDPTEVVALLPEARNERGLVNGYKLQRGDSLLRIVVGRLYHQAARLLFRLRVRDVDCDFRLMRRQVLQKIGLTSHTGAICTELVRGMQDSGWGIAQVPVHHYARPSGRSQFFVLRRIAPSLVMLLRLWVSIVLMPALRRSGRRGSAALLPALADLFPLAGL